MISYKDLGLLILFLIISGVGVYTFITLNNLNGILKRVRELMDKNSSNIDKTLDRLPSIASNVDDATAKIKDEVENAGDAVGLISETVTDTVLSVSDGTQEVIEYIRIIAQIIKIIINTFFKKSK
ncbi:MAG: hypothetical protein M0P77_03310 [Firmicutes bacterium]|nr:hypothetical protein [Bacillota bacterium]